MSSFDKTVNMDVEQTPNEKTVLDKNMDKAAKFMAETQEYPPLSPEAEKKLMRKVDWIMIPIVSSLETELFKLKTDVVRSCSSLQP